MLANSLFVKNKPTTPSLRGTNRCRTVSPKNRKIVKSLYLGIKGTSTSRDRLGHITSGARWNGTRKLIRKISFSLDPSLSYQVIDIQYDPNRTANIALVKCISHFENKSSAFQYIICPEGLKKDDIISANDKMEVLGVRKKLIDIIPGTSIHCVEIYPGSGAVFARSAGTFVTILSKELGYANVRLTSGEIRKIPLNCEASIGVVSNGHLRNEKIGKAGRNVYRGQRPKSSANCKNPVDHPLGGRSSHKKRSVSAGGRNSLPVSRGQKTRKNKRGQNLILKRRR